MATGAPPTAKGRDQDFSPMLLRMKAPCACTCPCCAAGRCGGHGAAPMSPLGERPLGCEGEGIAVDALKRRLELIEGTLLPQAKALAGSMARANEQGTIGFGELELLSALQHWILQLQVEQDGLRLALSPPPAGVP